MSFLAAIVSAIWGATLGRVFTWWSAYRQGINRQKVIDLEDKLAAQKRVEEAREAVYRDRQRPTYDSLRKPGGSPRRPAAVPAAPEAGAAGQPRSPDP